MPRSRMVKPEFWTDEKTGMLEPVEKCLLLGMLNYADDEGLIKANPLYLKSVIFPYDSKIKTDKIKNTLRKLSELGLIFLYTKNNQSFAWIIKFRVHQRIDKPQKPQNPCPSIQNNKYHEAIFKRDSFICYLCGEYTDIQEKPDGPNSKFPSVDHILPKSKEGSDYPTNLKTACISCNKNKGSKIVPELFQDRSENTPDETIKETIKEKNKKHKLKEDFSLSDDLKKYAVDRDINPAKIDELLLAFKDYHIGRGNLMVDWGRAWQQWVRNAPQFSAWAMKDGGNSDAYRELRNRLKKSGSVV